MRSTAASIPIIADSEPPLPAAVRASDSCSAAAAAALLVSSATSACTQSAHKNPWDAPPRAGHVMIRAGLPPYLRLLRPLLRHQFRPL